MDLTTPPNPFDTTSPVSTGSPSVDLSHPPNPFQTDTTDTTQQAVQSGADPQDLLWAKQHVDPVRYKDLCLQFVDDSLGLGAGRSPTAIAAWMRPSNKTVNGMNGIQPGDAIFFSPTAEVPEGHVGIYEGNGNFISGEYGSMSIKDWLSNPKLGLGQQVLGYMPRSQFGSN